MSRRNDPRWIGSFEQIQAVKDRCEAGDAAACKRYAAHRQVVEETRARRKAERAARRAERERANQNPPSNNYPVENGTVGRPGTVDRGTYDDAILRASRTASDISPAAERVATTFVTRTGVDEEGFSYTETIRVPVDSVPTVAANLGVDVRTEPPFFDAFGNEYAEAAAAAIADGTAAGAAQVAQNEQLEENQEVRDEEEVAQERPAVNAQGQPSSPNYTEQRTSIRLPNGTEVDITKDSFLQGLVGSLSDILGQGLDALLNKLPGAIGDLLNATGLTGALSGLLGGLSDTLGQALGDLTGALGDAAQGLLGGLGDVISDIPGVGPIFDQVSNDIGAFTSNLTEAYGGLDPTGKALVDGAIGAVGANLLNKVNIPGLGNIDPGAAAAVTAGLSFATNPAIQLQTIANSAGQLDELVRGSVTDTTYANLSSTARRAAAELAPAVQQGSDGRFRIANTLQEGNADNVRRVVNGVVSTTSPAQENRQPETPQVTRNDANNIADRYRNATYPNFDAAFNALNRANADPTLIQFGIQFSGAIPREDGTYRLIE